MKATTLKSFSRNQSDKSIGSASVRSALQTLRDRFGNYIRKKRSVANNMESAFAELDFTALYDGSYPYNNSNDTNLFYY